MMLQDFGVKIPHAKKDLRKTKGPTTSALWPKKEVDSISNRLVRAFAYATRQEALSYDYTSHAIASFKLFIEGLMQGVAQGEC